jgi:hypothetical protein
MSQHCKQEVPEHESTQPAVECVYCKEPGHRARDCPKERVNPYACKNCKQEGHNSKECPKPRSAEGIECRKCNETGHFSKDVSTLPRFQYVLKCDTASVSFQKKRMMLCRTSGSAHLAPA